MPIRRATSVNNKLFPALTLASRSPVVWVVKIGLDINLVMNINLYSLSVF